MTQLSKTRYLVQLSIFTAIIIIMSFTPLGYLKIGVMEISLLSIPVAIGAIALGPKAGAILGSVFGITSFAQCFGFSAFGTLMMGINPFFTFLVCVPTRVLTGLICGLVFQWFKKMDRKTIGLLVASGSCALSNTILYMSTLMLLFGQTDMILEMQGDLAVIPFIIAVVGINGVIELVSCIAVGSGFAKLLSYF